MSLDSNILNPINSPFVFTTPNPTNLPLTPLPTQPQVSSLPAPSPFPTTPPSTTPRPTPGPIGGINGLFVYIPNS